MATEALNPPSLDQFMDACRESLAYLDQYGFEERPIPYHRAGNRFQLWYCAGDRLVIVFGEGYGTTACIQLEHSSGVQLSEIYLVPAAKRPPPYRIRKARRKDPSQLDQIRKAAERLHTFGEDFLRGDLERFLRLAKPLPSYLREPARDA
jgi:hypothetical protein